MNLLDQHLHRLFLDHDCVVVPGLGGFVCNRIPARYDVARQELVPPVRSVLFNERIIHHDGVLVEAIARSEASSMDEALAAVEAEAAVLKAELQAGKTIRIHQVGRLYAGDEGRLQFMPDEEMERILRSFGLKRIPLQPLENKNARNPLQPAARVIPMPDTPRTEIQSPWIRVAAAIAVPVIGGAGMFFMENSGQDAALMSTLPTVTQTHEVASYQPRFLEEAIQEWEAIDESTDLIIEVRSAVELPKPLKDVVEPSVVTESTDIVFMLVAGSFTVASNAHNHSAALNQQGFVSEIYLQENGSHLVTFATHLTESDARAQLKELRSDETTDRAWLKRLDSSI